MTVPIRPLEASAAQDDGREHVELPPDQGVGHNLFDPVRLHQSRDSRRHTRVAVDEALQADQDCSPCVWLLRGCPQSP